MKIFKKIFLTFVPFILVLALTACNSSNEVSGSKESVDFPKKTIKIIVGFAPGGGTDTVARIIAKELGKHFENKVNLVVENKPGGSAVVGATEVVNSNPDGYTLGFTPSGPFVIQPHLGQTTYSYNDAVPISQVTSVDFILAVHKDAPWDDFESFVEDAKANPGKYSYGVPGANTTGDLAMKAMAMETGIEIKSVPFKGGAPTRTALLGKDVDLIAINDDDIVPYAKDGDIKLLLNLGEKTYKDYPDLRTIRDLGYNINSNAGYLLYGPKGLPTEIRDTIDRAMEKMLQEESVVEALNKIGYTIDYMNAADRTKKIEEEYNAFKEIFEKTK